jgi:uncharacterized protein YyaL (SSP411 family)
MLSGLARRQSTQILAPALAVVTWSFAASQVNGQQPKIAPANRLVNSANPYLLQHAHNPVDWYPWGEEAIARARRENKPIFLSVGYSTCYWCHVAERTIYSNAAIAALMNEWFVNIKVDREERPDIDETYMLARNLLTGSGGWPNNLFLTPDLKPFFAGSYFPPENREGRLAFPGILRLIHTTWQKDPAKVEATAKEVHDALSRLRESRSKGASHTAIVPADWLATARDRMLRRRDAMSGGFDGGGGTKFPQSPVLALLLTDYRNSGTSASLQTAAETLEAIAFGGIHDHLAGGVHRYSTEPTWSVPHFEKMLYDNAQLLGLYAELYAIARQPLARQMASDIVGYLTRRMMAPEGAFYTAEDAEIEGKEGENYLWSRAEITEVLGDADADRFFVLYELIHLPTEPAGPGVLRVRLDRAADMKDRLKLGTELEGLAPLRAKLLEVRDRRKQPLRDDKIVVAVNGLAIGALARSGAVFGQPAWVSAAERAGELLWNRAFDAKTGNLRRYLYRDEARGDGFLEDYALLALGYLTLGEASGEAVWSTRASVFAEAIVNGFIKPDGRVVTTRADATSIVPAVDLQDHDTPSGTSAAYALLARLGKAKPRYADLAAKILARMADKIEASPQAWASFTATAALFADPAKLPPSASVLDSAAHVRATASLRSCTSDLDEIAVTIAIDPGYHANAHPASLEYLIPTTVSVPDLPNAKITYPQGQTFKPKFLPEGISVYEGTVLIKVELPHGSLASPERSSVNVDVQVCDLQTCLPPSTIAVKIDR